jgi:hypothetical protein
MPITLNGDNGITNVNGSAAAPAITGTDTDSGMYFATNSVSISTAGTAALTIDSSQNATFTGYANMPNTFGFKNRIINGAMMIDQRNAGASVTPTVDGSYNLDRWKVGLSQASKFSVQQNAGSVTPPVGFTNYLGATSLSAYSVGSGDTFLIQQNIEGLNCSDLAFGTANAVTVTLSFWVRSSLTGTFGGSLLNSAANRSYPFSYTISAANTWEQKTITIAGDTTGTWLVTSGIGLGVRFGLGSGSTFSGTAGAWAAGNIVQPTGSVSVVGTNGATFYITGVQLEKGSTATSFDYRPYGQELALCQRYYEVTGQAVFVANMSDGFGRAYYFFKTTKRANPTVVNTGGAGSITATTDLIYSAQSGGAANIASGATASAEL